MAAPDQQPEDGIQSRVHSTGPRTPPSKHLEHSQLIFFKYKNPGNMSTDEKLEMVDVEVRAKLTAKGIRNSNSKANCLYVFSTPGAEGHYKVGHTQSNDKRIKDQMKCYPEQSFRLAFECPNAYLFEQVVLAEFLLSRRKHWCNRCEKGGRQHIEWIEAPLEDIIDSLNAWSEYANYFYKYGTYIEEGQNIPLPNFSPCADRWRKWAVGRIKRWTEIHQSRMAPTSGQYVQERTYETKPDPQYGCETRPKDEYFLDSVPDLSDSPGSTPGSGGIQDPPTPPTPPTPTPAGRGLAMDGYTPKQRDALWTSEEEADWEYATAKPIARPLFTNRRQRPSDKGRRSLCAEDPAFHAPLTEGCSKNDADRGTQSSLEKKGYIHGISDADIKEERWRFMKEVVAEAQDSKAEDSKAERPQVFGTIYFLSFESAEGLYRVCYRNGNRRFSPEKECCDSATRFYNIPNCMDVKKKLLTKFKVLPPNPECELCGGQHRDWIKIPDRDVTTGIEAPKGPVDGGGPDVHGHDCELSDGDDKKSGIDAAAEAQKIKTAVEDVPINIPPAQMPVVDYQSHNFPDGKANNSIGRLGEAKGKPTLSTEQQAPGLLDLGIAAARGILSGLF
ncbi:GIY-YIG nuclease family protein [Aspergillus foveolatus]|uniref:GIY-YIG nuclease family protein n=1 Tax=Aspergillus foveolatus TaxID=210207 RepID=UPI003CCCEECE